MSGIGFYVSPNGDDNNAGTIDSPLLTLSKAQQAMRAAPVADRTAYLLSGTYNITSPIVLNSQDDGETWTTYPGNAAQSAVLMNGSSDSEIFNIYDQKSVQNLVFSNLNFDGGPSGGNAIFISSNGNNIHVQNDLFRNHFNGSDLYIYNSDNVYFQGNTSGPNELQPVTGHVTDGKVHGGLFVTDNNISGFNRIGVELQQNSAGYFQNVHLDRNLVSISAKGNPAGNMVFSLVAGPSSVGNTVWGNTVTGVRGDNQAFLELGTNNTSVEYNSITQIDWGISFSSARGSEVENNIFKNDGQAFSPGGAYNDTQWVGVNTVNGVVQNGWNGVPNATSKPVVWSPSAVANAPAPTVTITDARRTVSAAAQTISGTVDAADSGSTVTIIDGMTKIGTATVSGTGAWSAAVMLANPGANVLTATDTNAAGTGISNAVTYTLQATGPTAPSAGPGVTIGSNNLAVPSDFNDDGRSDILWQNTSGQAAIWEMSGTNGIAGANVGANPGPNWHTIGTGDFNGDGHSDILWQNTDGQAAIWEMNGTNVMEEATVGDSPGPSWKAIGTGDFNGDGHSDILWQNTNGQAAIWEMNGSNPIGTANVGDPGPSWKAIGTGDFNGDGHSDILWQNASGQVASWEMNGNNIMGTANIGDPGPSWKAIGTGDFNGDGHSDILWQNTNGQAAIWEMSGNNIIGTANMGDPGPSWKAIGTGDFNGDGHSDILWQNRSGQVAIWEINGTNVMGEATVGGSPGPSWLAIKS